MIAPIGKNCIPCPSKVPSDHTNLALTHCAGLPILVGLAARDLDRGSLARLARRRVARGRGGQGLSLPHRPEIQSIHVTEVGGQKTINRKRSVRFW